MSGFTKTFFVRELARLRRNIATLERELAPVDPDDPRFAGQRTQLDNLYRNREQLFELTEYANNPAALLMACRMAYARAEKAHERCPGCDHRGQPGPEWWASLGKMQYLTHLLNDLNQVMHQSPHELHEALRAQVRAKDLGAATEQMSVLRAMAQAEGTATEHAHLVRDFIEAGEPGANGHNGLNGRSRSNGSQP
jgi:hypothetical protein